jgi:hypothetical protein
VSSAAKAGAHIIPRERAEALRDYREAVDMLQSVWVTLRMHANRQDFSERYLLERVDAARQALHIIAATAAFVGKQ